MQPDATSIVYGTDRPRLLAGRTLLLTSGPTYDSVRAYGIWLPAKPLLVTVSGIATGNLTVAWEYPWREQTTEIWRNAIIRSAMSTRHAHRHGLKPAPGNGSRTGAEQRRPPGRQPMQPPRPLRTGHAAYPGLGDDRRGGTARRIAASNDRYSTTPRSDPDNGDNSSAGMSA